MAEAAIPLMVVGSLVSASGTIAGGKASQQYAQTQAAASNYQAGVSENTAAILETNAGQERAAAQRTAAEDRRRARLAASRAQAVAAASGGGASDPTVTGLISDIQGEGEYRALASLWQGEDRARNLQAAAYDKRAEATGQRYTAGVYDWQGDEYRRAANIKAISTLLSAGTGIAGKYK